MREGRCELSPSEAAFGVTICSCTKFFQWFTSNLGHCVSDHKFQDHQENPHSQCVLKKELLESGGGSSLKRPGGSTEPEGARTCHQGRLGLCPSRTSSFLDSEFKQGLCLNEKRTGSTLCYENQILFPVKITSKDRPPLWILQPAFCPQMYIKPGPKVRKEINKALQ